MTQRDRKALVGFIIAALIQLLSAATFENRNTTPAQNVIIQIEHEL